MFVSRFMPCSECGQSVECSAALAHRCRTEHMVDYQMFGLREDVAELEARLRDYLHTTTGHFDVWLAARQVRHGVR